MLLLLLLLPAQGGKIADFFIRKLSPRAVFL